MRHTFELPRRTAFTYPKSLRMPTSVRGPRKGLDDRGRFGAFPSRKTYLWRRIDPQVKAASWVAQNAGPQWRRRDSNSQSREREPGSKPGALLYSAPRISRGGETRTHTFHGLDVVSLPIGVRPYVPNAKRLRLRMAVRAQEPQVLPAIVPSPAVDVIYGQDQRFAVPLGRLRAHGATVCGTPTARSALRRIMGRSFALAGSLNTSTSSGVRFGPKRRPRLHPCPQK